MFKWFPSVNGWILFFWINIYTNYDECIENFIKLYNVEKKYRNEIKNKFVIFINEFKVLF